MARARCPRPSECWHQNSTDGRVVICHAGARPIDALRQLQQVVEPCKAGPFTRLTARTARSATIAATVCQRSDVVRRQRADRGVPIERPRRASPRRPGRGSDQIGVLWSRAIRLPRSAAASRGQPDRDRPARCGAALEERFFGWQSPWRSTGSHGAGAPRCERDPERTLAVTSGRARATSSAWHRTMRAGRVRAVTATRREPARTDRVHAGHAPAERRAGVAGPAVEVGPPLAGHRLEHQQVPRGRRPADPRDRDPVPGSGAAPTRR